MPSTARGPFLNSRTRFSASIVFGDRKSTRLNSSHLVISYAVFCLKKKIIFSFDHLAYRRTLSLALHYREQLSYTAVHQHANLAQDLVSPVVQVAFLTALVISTLRF